MGEVPLPTILGSSRPRRYEERAGTAWSSLGPLPFCAALALGSRTRCVESSVAARSFRYLDDYRGIRTGTSVGISGPLGGSRWAGNVLAKV